DGIRDRNVTGVQTCALPIWCASAIVRIRISWILAYNDKPVADHKYSLQSPTNIYSGEKSGICCRIGLDDGDGVVCYRVDILAVRSEERRVGKECRCLWWTDS